MQNMPLATKRVPSQNNGVFRLLYMMGFVFSLSLALPMYVNSSFLSEYTSEKIVGVLYTLGSVLTFFTLAMMPKVLTRLGNYRAMLLIALLTTVLLLGLALVDSFIFIAPIFILYSSLLSVVYFNFDVFLESYSSNAHTGGIRGLFLTVLNIAIVLGPFLAGLLLTNGDYWKIYLLAAGLVIVLMLLLLTNFRTFKDPVYVHVPFWQTLKRIWNDGDVYHIFVANLFLRFFYAWMVIYMPLYLHNHIGFEWSEIGTIFTIMLLPFILFELPAGKLADSRFGEKEIMTVGFIIMGLATMATIFLSAPILWMWAGLLFVTRIGASLVEIMTETYFFKHVSGADADIIGFFRNNRPIAYSIAPLTASIVLAFMDFKFLFLILGIVMLLGIRYSLSLKDTR